jgi:hypothetical protein
VIGLPSFANLVLLPHAPNEPQTCVLRPDCG